MFVTDGGNNDTGWGDPQYDQMLADLREHGRSRRKRMQILHDMEKILVEDEVPIVPVYFWVGMSLYYPGQARRLRAELRRRSSLGRVLSFRGRRP